MKQKLSISTYKYRLVTGFFLIGFAIIVVRLFQIQVLNAPKYKALAREQQWHGIKLQAKRGEIYTKDEYPVASNETTYYIYADMNEIEDYNRAIEVLDSNVENFDKTPFINENYKTRKWLKVAEKIPWNKKEIIEANLKKGLYYEEDYHRYYPENYMLGQVLGFVGLDEIEEQVGYFGLEQYYDGDLKGKNGWILEEKSALGLPILWGDYEIIEPLDGSDLYLTIDRSVQYIIENALQDGVKKSNAKSGTIIVVEPSTGEIIGLANYPFFEPLNYKDNENSRNNAISSVYEPGSVMKALTMSTAIDLGTVNPNTVYNDTGPKYFSGHMVDNWDGKHHGEETMIEVLQHSNNLGAAWVGLQVGDENLMKYFKNFGMGTPTDIDLEGEEKGLIYNEFPLKDIEIANASFGQGISVTPLQMVMAFGAIANEGNYMKPYIVEKIKSKDKLVTEKPTFLRSVLKPESAAIMVDMLTKAVSGGEAKFFVLKNYNVAGKTGTAQVPIAGGYDPDRTNATFIGFFPNYRKFVMLVKLEEPTFPSGYASETAVPLWMDIAEKLANYYGFAPDVPEVKEEN